MPFYLLSTLLESLAQGLSLLFPYVYNFYCFYCSIVSTVLCLTFGRFGLLLVHSWPLMMTTMLLLCSLTQTPINTVCFLAYLCLHSYSYDEWPRLLLLSPADDDLNTDTTTIHTRLRRAFRLILRCKYSWHLRLSEHTPWQICVPSERWIMMRWWWWYSPVSTALWYCGRRGDASWCIVVFASLPEWALETGLEAIWDYDLVDANGAVTVACDGDHRWPLAIRRLQKTTLLCLASFEFKLPSHSNLASSQLCRQPLLLTQYECPRWSVVPI